MNDLTPNQLLVLLAIHIGNEAVLQAEASRGNFITDLQHLQAQELIEAEAGDRPAWCTTLKAQSLLFVIRRKISFFLDV